MGQVVPYVLCSQVSTPVTVNLIAVDAADRLIQLIVLCVCDGAVVVCIKL